MTAAPAAARPAARAKPVPSEPAWVIEARKMLGTVEGAGPKDNPAVVHLFLEAGHPEIRHDAVPWCAAFVGAMLKRAGIKPTGTLAARDYEKWGQATPGGKPVFGCVGVKKRKGGGWLGHVGFVVGASASEIILLGGNQYDEVCVAAFPRAQFTAFRWPANLPVPADLPKLPVTVTPQTLATLRIILTFALGILASRGLISRETAEYLAGPETMAFLGVAGLFATGAWALWSNRPHGIIKAAAALPQVDAVIAKPKTAGEIQVGNVVASVTEASRVPGVVG